MSTIVTRSMARKRKAGADFTDSLSKRSAVPIVCIVCNTNSAKLKTLTCGHTNLCVDCYLQNRRWAGREHRCERCGERIYSYASVDPSVTTDSISDTRCDDLQGIELFTALKSIFSMLNVMNISIDSMIEAARAFIKSMMTREKIPLISVDACESLLVHCNNMGLYEKNNGSKLRNMIVSLCRYPWKVDVSIGTHGICYHGNGGYVGRSSIGEAAGTIERNIDFIIGKCDYF